MDYGGFGLFQYIVHNTKRIKNGEIPNKIWINHTRKLFKQMCLYINWLHNNGVCHLDISLENCLIKDNVIYFCDFGLSEQFNDGIFTCNKFVGKPNYKSPEVSIYIYQIQY